MAQLAPRPGRLAVIVKCQSVDGQQAVSIGHVAEKIDHGRVPQRASAAERHAADRAKMVLKLAGDAPFDAPMSGIMNSRRHFIGEQTPFDDEKLNGEDADVPKTLKTPRH